MGMKASAFLAISVLCVAISLAARAEEVDVLGVFQDWRAYKTTQAGKPLCYMAGEPKKAVGKYKKRGKIYAMVSHRPGAKTFDVFSVHAGYTYKEGSSVTVGIGGDSFTLFTHGDVAWARKASHDRALVRAMKAGRDMVVRGVSSRGTKTTDTYSLLGFSAAYSEISSACRKR